MSEKVVVFWSGGKDSALALERLLRYGKHEPVSLITTVFEGTGRVSMHGLRTELITEQAKQIGLPLHFMKTSAADNQSYERALKETLDHFAGRGITKVM